MKKTLSIPLRELSFHRTAGGLGIIMGARGWSDRLAAFRFTQEMR